ncbi:MAG: FAD-binding oxidoreductase [Pseudomonadota bacterium]
MTARSLDQPTYYAATANRQVATSDASTVPDKVDVCVIGAGFTGLSAALELTLQGRTVAVFDSGPIGWGATGRNGGQICTGYSPGMEGFEKQLGSGDARICFDVAEQGKRLIEARIKAHNIDCDLVWGFLHAAARPSHMTGLAEHMEELEKFGVDSCSLLSSEELAQKLGSKAYYGALLERDAGHFHSLNYALGLADAVIGNGGRIFEKTIVAGVDGGSSPSLKLQSGKTVACEQVVVACNAYLGALVPGLNHRVMPVASYVVATEPLGIERAGNLIRDNEAVCDSNYVVDYFRLTGDNRLLFGGRCSYSGIHPRDLGASMRPRVLRIFPQLVDVKMQYAWGGHIGITHNRLPNMGRSDGSIYYAHGFSGQGVVLAGMLGKILADAICGDTDRFDVFARIRHLPFPGGVLRRPALTLGMLYYRIKDLLS